MTLFSVRKMQFFHLEFHSSQQHTLHLSRLYHTGLVLVRKPGQGQCIISQLNALQTANKVHITEIFVYGK